MIEKKILLPEDVEAKAEDCDIIIKGKLGEIRRSFSYPALNILLKDKEIIVSSTKDKKKQKAIVGSWCARIKNMIVGVNKPYEYKLKIVFSHFPMKITLESDRIVVKNYLGGKGVREVQIPPDIELNMVKEDNSDYVIVKGINKEHAGLYAAKIERLCVAKNKDRRVFQDGIYIIKKP